MIAPEKEIPKIETRQMTETDLSEAMEIKNAEGWNQTLEDWRFCLSQNPRFCLVATNRETVIATVTAVGYESKLAWIGMMLVRKEFRGLGIGKLLMEHILKKLKGFPAIKLDATPAGFPLYEKLGFVKEYSIFRSVRPAAFREGKGSHTSVTQQIRAIKDIDFETITEYDRNVFGVNRSVVLKYLMTQSPESAWLAEEGRTVRGYLLGRRG